MRRGVYAALALACTGVLAEPAWARSQAAADYGDFLAGSYARRLRDPGLAMERLESALMSSPRNGMLLQGAAEAALESGDIARAAEFGRRAAAVDADSPAGRLAIAALALRKGQGAFVRRTLTEMTGSPSQQLSAQVLALWAQVAVGDLDGALTDLSDDQLSDNPGWRALQHYLRAMALDASGRSEEAISAYAAGHRAGGLRIAQIVKRHGALLAGAGRPEDARTLYAALLDSVDNPGIRDALERLERSAPSASSRLELASAASISLFALSVLLEKTPGGADEKRTPLALAVALDPRFEGVRFAFAGALQDVGNEAGARRVLGAIPAASPYHATARVQIAFSLHREKRSDEAAAMLRRMANGSAGQVALSLVAVKGLADLYRQQERYADAAPLYARLVQEAEPLKPRDWRLLFAQGATLERAGRFAEAEVALQRALQLSPNQPEVMNYLGYHWVDTGARVQEGLAILEEAARRRPDEGYILDSLGWAHFRLGAFEKATQILEAAIVLSPGDATINDHLGDAYWRTNRRIEARYQWQRVLTLEPTSEERAGAEQKLKSGLPAPAGP